MRLVADIGGTNSRLALVPLGSTAFERTKSYRNVDFDRFEDIISDFLPSTAKHPDQLVIAMAGPVANNVGCLTNLDWVIDGHSLSAKFGSPEVYVVNDLTALGHSVFRLTSDQLVSVLDQPVRERMLRQALVVGIGTGFNVSPVVEHEGQTICPAVEAGHTTLFASICRELERVETGLSQEFPTVEALFSGRGRRKFLSLLTGVNVESASPYIARQGHEDNAAFDCALDGYAILIGMLLAEFKISYLPNEGIFLAGGVARSSIIGARSKLCANAARKENGYINASPPVWVINDDMAALTGCATLEVPRGSPKK